MWWIFTNFKINRNMNILIGIIFLLSFNITFRIPEVSTKSIDFSSTSRPTDIFVNSEEGSGSLSPTEDTSGSAVSSWNRIEKDGAIYTGEIKLPQNYSKYRIPLGKLKINDKEQIIPVPVKVSIFFRRFLEINEQTEEILIDSDFALQWTDWDISDFIANNNFTTTGSTQNYITLAPEFLNRIWKPDVYIDEMSAVGNASLLSPLITLKLLLKLKDVVKDVDSGDVIYSSRNALRLRCPMDFTYYPADTQTCIFHLRSYSYYDDQLKLSWSNEGIFLNDPSHANFHLQVSDAKPSPIEGKQDFHVTENFTEYRTGTYSALEFRIKMRRKLSYQLVLTYLPSVVLILITWLCFLIPSSMVEARIGISMTTVLTLTAMFTSVREQSPTVSYTMAIDFWMVFHIFIVFLALALCTAIYWMKVRVERYSAIVQKQKTITKTTNEEETCFIDCQKESENENETARALNDQKMYNWIVTFSKRYGFWAFAFIYVTFLCLYWTWLLVSSDYLKWEVNSYFTDTENKYKFYMYSETVTSGKEL